MQNKTIEILNNIIGMIENNKATFYELKKSNEDIIQCVKYEFNNIELTADIWTKAYKEIILEIQKISDVWIKCDEFVKILKEVSSKLQSYIEQEVFYVKLDETSQTWDIRNKEKHFNDEKYIFLNKEFDKFYKKLINNENFTLMRWGDGEKSIIVGDEVYAQEKWYVPKGESDFGNKLFNALQLVDAKVWHGISCPCCDSTAYYWYRTHLKSDQVTFANLWVNGNYQKFIKGFMKIKRDAVIIGNSRGKNRSIGNLNILKYYEVSDDCLDFFNNHVDKLIENIICDYGNNNNLLYVISAGPLSEYIIAKLFKNNPENCYVDFGSSIDAFIHNEITRPYMIPGTIYAEKNCWMHNAENTSIDISVVMTLYKRPDVLLKQLEAIENQTIKPKEILLFQDAIDDYYEIKLKDDILSRFDNVKICNKNQGVWGRFEYAKHSKSDYVCLFDDDTIPGNRWLENCYTHMLQYEAVYGTIGIEMLKNNNYPYDNYYRVGWANPYPISIEVDFVGHSWFVKKEYLNWMFSKEGLHYRDKYKFVAEDMYLSYACKCHNVKTIVPAHYVDNVSYWGSMIEDANKYGYREVALSMNPQNLERMKEAISEVSASGYKSIGDCYPEYVDYMNKDTI